MSSIIVAVLVLLLSVVHPVDAKKKTIRKNTKELIGETFRLKVPLVKLSYSFGEDEHSTHIYGDSSIVYRVRTSKLVEVKGKSFGEALAEGVLEGRNEIANNDPQEFIKEVRDNNKKYKGQILAAGSQVIPIVTLGVMNSPQRESHSSLGIICDRKDDNWYHYTEN